MIEIGKKYKTRDGREVEVLRTDIRDEESVLAIIKDGEKDTICRYLPDGTLKSNRDFNAASKSDLVEQREPFECVAYLDEYNNLTTTIVTSNANFYRDTGYRRKVILREVIDAKM